MPLLQPPLIRQQPSYYRDSNKAGSRALPTTPPNTGEPRQHNEDAFHVRVYGLATALGFPFFPAPSLLAESEDENGNENSHQWDRLTGYVVLLVLCARQGLEDKSIKVLPAALVRRDDRNTPLLPVFEEKYTHFRC